jgi:hemolysin activation/secretion protein
MLFVKYVVLLIFTIFLFKQSLASAYSPILKNHEQQRQNILLDAEINKIEKIKNNKIENWQSQEKHQEYSDDFCLNIQKITLTGNEVFSVKFLLDKFVNLKKGACVTKNSLAVIKNNLQNFYLKKGYVMARIYYDLALLPENHLKIIIAEGKLGEIILKDNSWLNNKLKFRRKTNIFSAFPWQKGKILNLKNIEQGLEQINALASNNAIMDMVPADEEGFSDVIIKNNINKTTNISLSYDNLGSVNTGKNNKNLKISQDNLLGFNDNILLSFTKDAASDQNAKYSFSNYAKLKIPFSYWEFNASFAESKYKLTIYSDIENIISKGSNFNKDFSLFRVLRKTRKQQLDFGFETAIKDSKNYNSGELLDDRRLSILRARLKNLLHFSSGKFLQSGFMLTDFSYHKGMNWFSAEKDENKKFSEPHAQFQKFAFSNYLKAKFLFFKKNITFVNNANMQLSLDELYGTEQISIGGNYSVRGFAENNISGDSGLYLRNDLIFNVAEFVNIPQFSVVGQRSDIAVFYDYGMVRKRGGLDKAYLSGAGISLNYKIYEENIKNPKNINISLTYSHSLHAPAIFLNDDEETIYFELGVNL